MKSPKTTISDNCCAFLPLTAILIGTRGSPWDPVKHAETLAAAAAMLGLTVPQLRSKARQLRIALPFAARKGRRP